MPDVNQIKHFGIKGMHWGVRRADSGSGPSEIMTRAKPGKMVKASGGKGHPAHEDAVRAVVAKQKAKQSSVHALSNKELQDLVSRMNMEQQYSRLITTDPGSQSDVKRIIKQVTSAGKTAQQVHAFVNSPAGKALKLAIKAKIGTR